MIYSKVFIDAFGYELAPNVVTSDDLESRLEPPYKALHMQKGQLETLTGIRERRFWDRGFPMYEGAIRAGKKAMDALTGLAKTALTDELVGKANFSFGEQFTTANKRLSQARSRGDKGGSIANRILMDIAKQQNPEQLMKVLQSARLSDSG